MKREIGQQQQQKQQQQQQPKETAAIDSIDCHVFQNASLVEE